jgi:type II secretory pathway pseudopilin PulG
MRSGSVRGARRQRGFAYMLLLVLIAILGIASSSAVMLGAQLGRRDAERQLLAIGGEFQRALRSYAGVPVAAPATAPPVPLTGRGPKSLEHLLKDPRVPGLRRHLRQVYADPLTGKAEWGLVTDSQGSILGIYSLAAGTPIQQAGFDPTLGGFEQAASYGDWVFGLPGARTPASAARSAASAASAAQK